MGGAKCPWGEMSWDELSMGGVVHGTKCPRGVLSMGRVVHGASCPRGEMTMGRNVMGRNVEGRNVMERNVMGRVSMGRVVRKSAFLSFRRFFLYTFKF